MLDLLRVQTSIEAANDQYPLSLTIISNSREDYRRVARSWRIPVHYLEWHPATFLAAVRAHSIAVFPITRNPFTLCKSANRPALALSLGLAVVADAIPSFRPLASACRLDDWQDGLTAYIADPTARHRDVRCGQELVARRYTLPVVSDRWRTFFDRLCLGL